MIGKREIIETATALGLNPHVVEKDYVLGWLLWGISGHEALGESWIFKGGSCLKKCFFETYRFSEDLDFTLTESSHIDPDFLAHVFAEIGERIYEETGIEMPADSQRFEIYTNPRGRACCEGRIAYRGPVSPRGRSMPRVKLDLSADEHVVLPLVRAPVFHPYSDGPEDAITVLSYAYEEAFAEKTRALSERARPRDLYDVINLFRNTDARPAAPVLDDVLRQKCEFKGIGRPTLAALEPYKTDLEGGWRTMLAHQLPALPPVEGFWGELPAFFAWLEGGAEPSRPDAYARASGEELIRERTLGLPVSTAARSHLEIIRFAASNRLCVELDYQGGTRTIEPYSLRRTREGRIVLHAHNRDSGEHRSYRVDRIQGARVSSESFVPRFEVELTPEGPFRVPATARRSSGNGPRRTSGRSRRRIFQGPKYVYECIFCGKHFTRKKQTTTLNPHKDKSGLPCPGRHAYWVDTH